MNPYRSMKLNLYRIDNVTTFALMIVCAACAMKGFIHLSYGILATIFLIFFMQMLCEGKIKQTRAEFYNGSCNGPNNSDQTAEHLAFWSILCALSVVIAGLLKGESFLLVILTGLCMVCASQPFGISFFSYAIDNRFQKELDKLGCSIAEGVSFSSLANEKILYIEDRCLLSAEQAVIEQLFTEDYAIDITGGANKALGEFFQNGRTVRIQNSPTLTLLLDIGILCNNGRLKKGTGTGWIENIIAPTGTTEEKALLVVGAKAGRFIERSNYTKSSIARTFAGTTIKYTPVMNKSGESLLFLLGGYDDLASKCDFTYTDNGTYPATAAFKSELHDTVQNILLAGGTPMIAAYCKTGESLAIEENLSGLTYVGIFNMQSPIASSTLGLLEKLKRQGIKPTIFSNTQPSENLKKLSKEAGVEAISNKKRKANICTCHFSPNIPASNLQVIATKGAIPDITAGATGVASLPNLIHSIRKYHLSSDSTIGALVSSAFTLASCCIFSTAVGLPVAAAPIYIMNYFLATCFTMISLLIFLPYKQGYIKPCQKNTATPANEAKLKFFLRSALCAVFSVQMFTYGLNSTGNSKSAVTCLVLTAILSQLMTIVECRNTNTNTLYTYIEKLICSIVLVALIFATASIGSISQLTGISKLPLCCMCLCLLSALLCDLLSNAFFIKIKH